MSTWGQVGPPSFSSQRCRTTIRLYSTVYSQNAPKISPFQKCQQTIKAFLLFSFFLLMVQVSYVPGCFIGMRNWATGYTSIPAYPLPSLWRTRASECDTPPPHITFFSGGKGVCIVFWTLTKSKILFLWVPGLTSRWRHTVLVEEAYRIFPFRVSISIRWWP